MKENIYDGTIVTKKDNFRLKHLSSDTYFNIGKYGKKKTPVINILKTYFIIIIYFNKFICIFLS